MPLRTRPSDGPAQLDLLQPEEGPHACGVIEAQALREGWGPLIGLDEAGRGPLAGPVVAAACVLDPACHDAARAAGLDDSKKLSQSARERLDRWIREHASALSVAVIDPTTIDAMNILRASLHGMAVAWRAVIETHPALRSSRVLVDGRDRAPLPDEVRQLPLIKGDSRSLHIAAASVLAKVTRDALMQEAHALWPEYGFDRHKGYPTAAHRRAIATHGPCPIHRRSFTLPERDAPTAQG